MVSLNLPCAYRRAPYCFDWRNKGGWLFSLFTQKVAIKQTHKCAPGKSKGEGSVKKIVAVSFAPGLR
ncbi:hypothetical protein [Shimia aestuarii]|uniref:hypothetical protein n=1 Tax=Shimia aestuarii TaxID=254406 RepID=UPI000B81B082|nr:hypothetical protein [Shimia aestuarii]